MAPRCHAPDAASEADRLTLSETESHHLGRVLRLTPGASVVVFDGKGREWDARIVQVTRRGVVVGDRQPRTPTPEPPVAVTLAVSLLKGDQMDAVVRDATMLGAAAIVPFQSERTVRFSREGAERVVARWQRVAIASAKQCARAVVPRIAAPATFGEVLGAEVDLRIVCLEPAVRMAEDAGELPRVPAALLAVGPEGGWAPAELEAWRQAGARPLALGPRTLRAEAAPTVALTALWLRWGWS